MKRVAVTFLAKVYTHGYPYLSIHVPVETARRLGLRKDDHVHVILTKFPELPVEFVVWLGNRNKGNLSLAQIVEEFQEWQRENAR